MDYKQETLDVIRRLISLTDNGRCNWSETSQKNQYKLILGSNVFYVGKSTKFLNAYDVEIVDNVGNYITKECYKVPEDSVEVDILYFSIKRFLERKYRKHMEDISKRLNALEESNIVIA